MPIIKSAKKRVKVANKAAVRNSKTKRGLKTALKAFVKKSDAKTHSAAQSNIDKAAKKGVIHKNKAARMKKQLAAKAKASGTKPAAKKTTPSKPVVKKAATKKPTTKKTPAIKKK